jgi:hypothetical protein
MVSGIGAPMAETYQDAAAAGHACLSRAETAGAQGDAHGNGSLRRLKAIEMRCRSPRCGNTMCGI